MGQPSLRRRPRFTMAFANPPPKILLLNFALRYNDRTTEDIFQEYAQDRAMNQLNGGPIWNFEHYVFERVTKDLTGTFGLPLPKKNRLRYEGGVVRFHYEAEKPHTNSNYMHGDQMRRLGKERRGRMYIWNVVHKKMPVKQEQLRLCGM